MGGVSSRTLDERGGYVCFWEDDGSNDVDRHSGPNHMTLRDAQANFFALWGGHRGRSNSRLLGGQQRYASTRAHVPENQVRMNDACLDE